MALRSLCGIFAIQRYRAGYPVCAQSVRLKVLTLAALLVAVATTSSSAVSVPLRPATAAMLREDSISINQGFLKTCQPWPAQHPALNPDVPLPDIPFGWE